MKKILITGGNGLVGSALSEEVSLLTNNEDIFIFATREQGDLTKEENVAKLFEQHKPTHVIHTAAKVGGIGGNMIGHAEYFYQNVLMNSYIIHYSYLHNVEKLLAFSSVCVFPDDIVMLKEDVMHNGPPFNGNFAYAFAKRMVDVQIRAYKSQYNVKNYCSIIPGNIYGKRDFYNLSHGHVIPSLIHKLYLAQTQNKPLIVWGDGKSLREFIYANDLAKILLNLIYQKEIPERLLISGLQQYSIKEVVDMLVEASGFKGPVVFDSSKPNGQRNRQSNLTLFKSLFPDYNPTSLKEGLKTAYNWFIANYPNIRL